MKTTLCLVLAVATLTSARAEIFRSGASHGSRGGGEMNAHRSGDHRNYGHRDYGRGDHRTNVHLGFGYGYGYGRGYGYSNPWYYGAGYGYYSPYRALPSYSYYPGYGVDYPYYGTYGYGGGSSAANGLLLGALAGGVIGNNSGAFHHSSWRGAAWGAGLGWLLGAVADSNRRPVVYQQASVAQPAAVMQAPSQPVAPGQPQQVTIINNYYNSSTPMSGANSLFGR
jgi:hypothetical protein